MEAKKQIKTTSVARKMSQWVECRLCDCEKAGHGSMFLCWRWRDGDRQIPEALSQLGRSRWAPYSGRSSISKLKVWSNCRRCLRELCVLHMRRHSSQPMKTSHGATAEDAWDGCLSRTCADTVHIPWKSLSLSFPLHRLFLSVVDLQFCDLMS